MTWENQLTYKLLTDQERNKGFYICADSSRLAEGSTSDRYKRAGDAYSKYGISTLNESREDVGLPPFVRGSGPGDEVIYPKGTPGKGGQM